jgi:hypothetical protein
MRTSELSGAALNWAVAKCEGKDGACEIHAGNVLYGRVASGFVQYAPSTNWMQGGPIIERECIAVAFDGYPQGWVANQKYYGATPLIAAMRYYVASKLGDDVEIPEGI